ncbi:MAG: hypothetical protein ACM3XM_14010, partial [Mycobacterium leprae]
MPPCLDVYVVSTRRDRDTITRFLNKWVDLGLSEDRGDEELMLLSLGAIAPPSNDTDWEWEPAVSLTHIVDRGLQLPIRAFAVYLHPKDPSLSDVTLAFMSNGQVVFGVSLDDPTGDDQTVQRARSIMHTLAQDFDAEVAFVSCEAPPPLTERDIPPTGGSVLYR